MPESAITDPNNSSVQAGDNSTAVGSISVGGSMEGSLIIGSHNVVGFTSDQVSTLITQISTTFQVKPFDGRCPYKGLETFNEEDSELFFGREKWIDNLLGRIKKSRTLFVTGQSGSGKSSLVRAGVIPCLKSGYGAGWLYATMKPGRDPIDALANAFSRLKDPGLGKYLRENAGQATVLHECAESALSENTNQRLVLYIDQFEEVFTQLSKDKAQTFINLLDHAATIQNGRVIVLFSMRSDFVPNCATYPQLNAILNQQFVQIGAMQPEELVSAIAQPALRVGLKIDPDLIAQIINDMKGEPGALPLMQFALKDLFDAEQAKAGIIELSLSDYFEHGGISQALERHANASLDKLTDEEKELARNVFSGLIEIGRGTQDTRRTALSNELIPAGAQADAIKSVVQKLASARLITTDATTVTISHEKLIDAWPWLKKLVNENRDVIALQNEIAADAKEWEEHQRDASYLYSGARLATAREKMKDQKLIVSGLAQDFIEQSIALQDAERKSRETLRRRITIGLVSGIAIALALAVFGFAQAQRATTNANKAQVNLNLANTAQVNAQNQQVLAQNNAATAVANEQQAKIQAAISRSQVLAVNSRSNQSTISRNLLLGIESFNLVKDYPYRDRIIAQQALADTLGQISGIPLIGHEDAIFALAFSPDGNWLVSSSSDATIRLWNRKNPTALPIILKGHKGFHRLTFSPDSQWLVSNSDDAIAHLWNMKDPSADSIDLKGHEAAIMALAFSPDSKWLATGSRDKTVRLWNMKDIPANSIIFTGHESDIYTLAFSPDGTWLATGGNDNTARLWNMSDPTAAPIVLKGHEKAVGTLAFSPDGQWLATGSDDSTARLWSIKDPTAAPIVLKGHEMAVGTLAFSPDGQWLATGSDDSTARLWSIKDPTAIPLVLNHQGAIFALAFSKDGQWLATGSNDKTARLWNIKGPITDPIILYGHEGTIEALAFSPDDQWLATGSSDKTIRLWNVKQPIANPIILTGHEIRFLAFSPDGQWLATGGDDKTARLWNVNDPLADPVVLKGHEDLISTLAFSSDGNWLATGSLDKTVRLWNIKDLSIDPIVLKGHETAISTLALSPDGKWLATGSYDGASFLWNMKDLSADAIVLNGAVSESEMPLHLAFSPDSQWLASSTSRLWSMKEPTDAPMVLKMTKSITTLAFSPDGNWLATGSYDDATYLWNMKDLSADPIMLKRGNEAMSVFGYGKPPLVFSPDSQWLVTSNADSATLLWNMKDPFTDPIVLKGHQDWVSALAFSPDSQWLATGSLDKTIRLFSLDTDHWLKTACQSVGRNFTLTEWAQLGFIDPYRKTCNQWPLELEPTPTASP